MATNSPFAALAAAQDFLLDRVAETPQLFRSKLRELISPGKLPLPLAMRDSLELIYAWREQLPEEMKAIGVAMAGSLVTYQQFGYQDGRGAAIASLLAGEEVENAPEPVRELTEAALQPQEAPPMPDYRPGPL